MAKKEITKKVVKRTQVQSAAVVEKHEEKKSVQGKGKVLKARKAYVVLAVVIIALGALLYVGRGLFVAAVVNGQPISRLSIVKETEKQSGKQALETIVRNTLIEQEARKSNVTITDAEIDAEIKKVESQLSKQGRKIDDVLALQGMTRTDLRKLIRLDKLVGKIVGKDVKVSDKEVAAYIEQNKEMLPQDQSEEQLRKTAAEAVKQNKLNEKVQAWLTALQAKAKVIYFVQY